MNQGGYVTLVGYVAREPTLRATKEGTLVADMRIGTASRYFDKKTGQWQDGDSSYFTVTCWRRLATAAKISLRKGEPVIVRGRFRTRTFADREGQPRTEIEITAEAFGHDLTRGVATFVQRGLPPDAVLQPRRPNGDAQGQGAAGQDGRGRDDADRDDYGPDDEDPGDGGPAGVDAPPPYGNPPYGNPPYGTPPYGMPSAGAVAADDAPASAVADRLLDESAIARFAEDLTDSGTMERELAGEEPAGEEPAEAVAAR